jgi:hypothetical protein
MPAFFQNKEATKQGRLSYGIVSSYSTASQPAKAATRMLLAARSS